MTVHLPETTEENVDNFEAALDTLICDNNLEAGAQLPSFIIAHILRNVYEAIRKDPVDWKVVLGNG